MAKTLSPPLLHPLPAFLDFLVTQGLVEKKRVETVAQEAERSDRSPEELLVESNIVPEEQLYAARAKFQGMSYHEVPPGEKIPKDVLRLMSQDVMQTYWMVPLARKDAILEVGMLAPEDRRARDALRFITARAELTPHVVQISLSTFRRVQKEYRTLGGEVKEALQELQQTLAEEKPISRTRVRKTEEIIGEEAPIIKTVAVIIKHAVEGRASDIHIEPTEDKLRVRFRVDGVLYTSLFLPKDIHPAVLARVKILSDLKIDETRIPQDGRFRTVVSKKNIDFRVAT